MLMRVGGTVAPDRVATAHRPPVPPCPAAPARTGVPVRTTPVPERGTPSGPDSTRPLDDLLAHFRARRSHRRSVRAARALTLVIAAGLLAVWLLHPPAAGGENRAVAAFPAWRPGDLFAGSSYRKADQALRDRLALRRYVVEAVGEASAKQGGTGLSPGVVLGTDGMPFVAEDFTAPCAHEFTPAGVDAGLRELRAIGAPTGRSVTVAIAPDKSSILGDQLGARGPALLSCANGVRKQTEQTWPAGTGAPVLTVWTELAAAQAKHPGEIFQFGDSHWTTRGALVFAQALVEQLADQGEAPDTLRGDPKGEHAYDEELPSDLYALMGLEKPEQVPVWKVTRKDVTVETSAEPTASGRGLVTYTTSTTKGKDGTKPAMITGSTLVINDSFFSRAQLELAPYFERLSVMHYDDFLPAVRAGTLPHFDRLIIETVQRGWPERAAWLHQGQPVYEAIAAELARPR